MLFAAAQLLGVSIFSFVAGLLGYAPGVQTELINNNSAARLGMLFAIDLMLVALVVFVLSHLGKRAIRYLKLDTKPSLGMLKDTALTYVAYFIVLNILIIAVSAVPGFNPDQEQQLGFAPTQGSGLVPVFLALVVLPPLAEEIFFRGFVYQSLRKFARLEVSAVATSLLFAAAHLEFSGSGSLNWVAALDTLVLSTFLIFLFERTKSLWPLVLLHAFKNAVAFIFVFL